jgi:hypothetical protein
MSPTLRHASLVIVALLAACGSEGSAPASEAEVPMRDTTAPPIQREALTRVDRTGLDPMNMVVELPWTSNRVSRDAAEAAATAYLMGVETLTTDAFDRVVFDFSNVTDFPGYTARITDSSEALTCGNDASATEADGDRRIVVTLTPATNTDSRDAVTEPTGLAAIEQPRFQRGGIACAANRTVVWTATIQDGDQVRVFELNEPQRLVVDVR